MSTNLYENLIKSLLRAKQSWFDRTPTSRIINRCTSEQSDIDTMLPVSFYLTLQSFFLIIGFFIIICIQSYYSIGFNIILMIYLIFIVKKYMKTSKDLKGITSNSRSNLISQLIQIKNGLIHIRCTESDSYILNRFYFMNDIYQNARVHERNIAERWLNIRSEIIALFFPIFTLSNI